MKRRRGVIAKEHLDAVVEGSFLPREVAHYLVDVLRLRSGGEIELADGSGRVVLGRLSRQSNRWRLVDCRAIERLEPSAHPITVLAGLVKPKRWRLIVEKSVELGVGELVPVITDHVDWRPTPSEARSLAERWARIALEASRQCRRAIATRVTAPVILHDAIARVTALNRLIAHVQAQRPWPDGDLTPMASTAILVGPEGGFSQPELEMARSARFEPVCLGGFALRTETAVTVLVAMARDRLGFARSELEGRPCP